MKSAPENGAIKFRRKKIVWAPDLGNKEECPEMPKGWWPPNWARDSGPRICQIEELPRMAPS